MLIGHDTGLLALFERALNRLFPVTSDNLTLKLFVNDITPTSDTIYSEFIEAAGSGYMAQELTTGAWTVGISEGIVVATYAQKTFTFSGPLTTNTDVYGYYVLDADNNVVTSELLSTPYIPSNNGDILVVAVKVKLGNGTPT